jgi:GTP cyclohydrolase II
MTKDNALDKKAENARELGLDYEPHWTKEEEEAFNEVEKQSNLGKQILRDLGQPYHFDVYVSPSQRNYVLEEVALEFDKMKAFGTTGESFASFVRGMKK